MVVSCQICGKQFESFRGLNGHMNAHIPSHLKRAESYKPPSSAVKAAKKGLAQRKEWGRGGLSPSEAKAQGIDSGVTRARKIASGSVSRHDVRRMSAFNRHRKNNRPDKKMPDGGPTAGTIAWNLWGGTSGVNWAKKKSAAMNAENFGAETPHYEGECGDCKQPMMRGIVKDRYGVPASFPPAISCQECGEVVCGSCHPKVCPLCEESYNAETLDYNSFTNDMEDLLYKYSQMLLHYDTEYQSKARGGDGVMKMSVSFIPSDAYFDDVDFDSEGDYAFPCDYCEQGGGYGLRQINLTSIRLDDGDAGYKIHICDPCLEKWESGVLFDPEGPGSADAYVFDAEAVDKLPRNGDDSYEKELWVGNDSSQATAAALNYLQSKYPDEYNDIKYTLHGSSDYNKVWLMYSFVTDEDNSTLSAEEGQLAKALAAVREKSKRYAPTPLRLTKLPHPDQKTLKDFEAEYTDKIKSVISDLRNYPQFQTLDSEDLLLMGLDCLALRTANETAFEADWRDLSRDSSGRWLPAGDDSTVSYDMTDMSWMTPSEYYQYVLEEPLDISDDIEDDTQTIEFQDRFVRYTAMTMLPQVIDALIEENELEIVSNLFADPAEAEGEIAFLKAVKRYQQFSEQYSAE